MKTIGLLGGMSWESTVPYYRQINEAVKARLGGLHSARIVLYSVDFAEIERLQHAGDWDAAGAVLAAAAQALARAGADFIVLCTNTMHKVAEEIQAGVGIPLLHIADAAAQRVRASGIRTVGLLGTRFTMEEDFYTSRLSNTYGLNVKIPDAGARQAIHRIIYDELVVGKVRPQSKARYVGIIENLVRQGAEGVILGCTEIGLLVHAEDSPVPLFDTTRIHAEAAVEYAFA